MMYKGPKQKLYRMNLFSVMIFTTKKAIDECPSQYMNVSQSGSIDGESLFMKKRKNLLENQQKDQK